MNINPNQSADSASAYKKYATERQNKSSETGKHSAMQDPDSTDKTRHSKDKTRSSEDVILDLSDEVEDKKDDKDSNKVGNGFADFDMDAFNGQMRSQLMKSINMSKEALRDAGVEFIKYNEDGIKYDLGDKDDIKAAEVPAYWNAENTSNRIVDFAMSFRGLAPELSDEEYIEQMRKAVQKGFTLAKKDLQDLPGPSAKLFNDTYDSAMKKFDDLLAEAKAKADKAEQ